MKNKIFCLMLSLAFILTGCNANKNNTVVATVGEEEITMGEFEFYLTSVKQQMQGTELSSDEDWQTKDINGKKAIEVAKEQALDVAAKNRAYRMVYEKMGKTLTDEYKESIKETKQSIIDQYEQDGGYDEFLKEANITDEFIDLLCESSFCSEILYSEFYAEQEVLNEEIATFYTENYDEYFAPYRRAKHVLILTQDQETQQPYSQEDKAKAKEKAEDIFNRAKAGENFDTLVEQYSEDPGSASNPDGYTFTDGEMVAEFQDGVDALKNGEIGFVESSYGYHIIQRLEVNPDYFKDAIISSIISERFDEYIEQKMDEYEIFVEEKEEINEALDA